MAKTTAAKETPKPTTAATQLVRDFMAARRVSVPIVAIQTADQAQTIAQLTNAMNGDAKVFTWDVINGLRPGNEGAKAFFGNVQDVNATIPPASTLELAVKMETKSVLFMMNAPRYVFTDAPAIQAIWNLRDKFKVNFRMVVLLGASMMLPPELSGDAVVFDDPLPTLDELKTIVTRMHEDASLSQPSPEVLDKCVDATTGLHAFAAEQVVAMTLRPTGIDTDALWERKRKAIEQTPGLKVWRGNQNVGDVRGISNVLTFFEDYMQGEEPPRAIVFIDEIEKQMAGAGDHGDNTGVSQDQHMQLLTTMEDKGYTGSIFIGHPGCGKSLVAKAIGGLADCPVISLDLGGLKSSALGASEQAIRHALQVIDSVSHGRALFLATCNQIGVLKPELRRRFTLPTFFFDLPTADERAAIWQLYIDKFKLDATQTRPDDDGWTGAEIRNVCSMAWRMHTTLVQAGGYIVPVAKSSADSIKRLRESCDGKFISASYPGNYTIAATAQIDTPGAARRAFTM